MSETSKRLAIGALALVVLTLFVFAAFFWLLSGVGCEDAEEATLNTVQCDHERGRSWVTLQGVLILCSGAALVAGTVWGVLAARLWPLAVAVALALPALAAVFVIQGVEVSDKPLPRLSNVRLIDRGCTVPCSRGIRVAFTVDREAEVDFHLGPARFEDIGGRQYGSGVLGQEYGPTTPGVDYKPGRQVVRVGGAILNPPEQRGSLPPGDYELELVARPPEAGNQRRQSLGEVKRRVEISPRPG